MANSIDITNGCLLFNIPDSVSLSTTFLRLGDDDLRLYRKDGTNTNGLFLINNAIEGNTTLLRHSDTNYLIFEDDRFALKVNGTSLLDFNIPNQQVSILNGFGDVELILNPTAILARSDVNLLSIANNRIRFEHDTEIAITSPSVLVNGVPIVTGSGMGATGLQGIQGATGVQGPAGAGVTGLAGTTGVQGPAGAGVTGLAGTTGIQGIQGSTGIQGPAGAGSTGLQGVTGIAGTSSGGGVFYATIPTDYSTIQAAIDAGARRILIENTLSSISLTSQITTPADEEVWISGPQDRDTNQNGGGFPNFGNYVEINAASLGTTAAFLIGARGRLNLSHIRLVNNTAGTTLIEYSNPDSFFSALACNLDADVGNSTIVSSPSAGFGDNIYADFVGCAIEMTDSSTDFTVPQGSLVVRGNPVNYQGDPSQDWHHFGLMVNTAVRDVSQYGHAYAVGNQPSGNDDAPAESRLEGSYIDAIHIDIASPPKYCYLLSTPSLDPASGGVASFVPLISFNPFFTGSQDNSGGPVAVGCKISIFPSTSSWASAPYSLDGLYITPNINEAFSLQNCKLIIKETNGGTPKINFTHQVTFGNITNCVIESVLSGSQQPLGNLFDFWSTPVDQTRFIQIQAMSADDLNRSSYFRDCQFDHCFVQDGGGNFSGTPAFDSNDGMELRNCTFTTPSRIGATSITAPTNPGFMRISGPMYNCRFNQIADENFGWENFIERIEVGVISSPAVDPGYGDFTVAVKDCVFGAGIQEVLVYNAQTPFATADWKTQHVEVTNNVIFGDLQVGSAAATNMIATVQGNTLIGQTSAGADIHAGSTTTPLQLYVSGRRAIVKDNSLYRPISNAATLGTTLGSSNIFVAEVANNTAPTSTYIGSGSNIVFTDNTSAGSYSIAF